MRFERKNSSGASGLRFIENKPYRLIAYGLFVCEYYFLNSLENTEDLDRSPVVVFTAGAAPFRSAGDGVADFCVAGFTSAALDAVTGLCGVGLVADALDRKSTRLNSSHMA